MIKKIIFSLPVFFSTIFISCNSSYLLKPINQNISGMETMFVDGNEAMISKKNETAIAIYGSKQVVPGIVYTHHELWLHILYQNNSNKRMNVIPEEIKVIGYNQAGITTNFIVYSAREYLDRLETTQSFNEALQLTAGAIQATNAGQSTSTTYGTTSGTIYGSDGSSYTGYGSSSSTTQTTDYGAQAEATARNAELLQKTAQQNAETYGAVEQGLIKSNTLLPGNYVEGKVMVKMDNQYTSKFIVEIPFGNDIHTITFIPKQ